MSTLPIGTIARCEVYCTGVLSTISKGAREQERTPVTTPQLESLIRLSEARARA